MAFVQSARGWLFSPYLPISLSYCRFSMYRLWGQVFHWGFSIFSIHQLYVDPASILKSPMFAWFLSQKFTQKFGSIFSRRFSGFRVNMFVAPWFVFSIFLGDPYIYIYMYMCVYVCISINAWSYVCMCCEHVQMLHIYKQVCM